MIIELVKDLSMGFVLIMLISVWIQFFGWDIDP